MTGLECGHRFCHSCWAEYLTTKVMSEGIGQTISCAAHNCETLIDDATVVKLVPDAKVRQKYQHLITNSFVEVCFFFFIAKHLRNFSFFFDLRLIFKSS